MHLNTEKQWNILPNDVRTLFNAFKVDFIVFFLEILEKEIIVYQVTS